MQKVSAEFAVEFSKYNNAAVNDPRNIDEFMQFVDTNLETIVNGQPQFIMFIISHFDLSKKMDERYVDIITRFIDQMPDFQQMEDLDFQTIVMITYFRELYMIKKVSKDEK